MKNGVSQNAQQVLEKNASYTWFYQVSTIQNELQLELIEKINKSILGFFT